MSETTEAVTEWQRTQAKSVRRWAIAVIVVSVIAVGTSMTWAIATTQRADHSDALYAQVYEEFVVKTGDSPDAPQPSEVVEGQPGAQGVSGPQGPRGEKGDRGAPGKDGQPGIAGAQGPKGDKGDPGSDGTNGINGTNGGEGPPGTPSTVPGPTGPEGVGVASVECLEDGTWRFTMTDTAIRDVPGPCRIVLTPEPTPDPTPTPEGDPAP